MGLQVRVHHAEQNVECARERLREAEAEEKYREDVVDGLQETKELAQVSAIQNAQT